MGIHYEGISAAHFLSQASARRLWSVLDQTFFFESAVLRTGVNFNRKAETDGPLE